MRRWMGMHRRMRKERNGRREGRREGGREGGGGEVGLEGKARNLPPRNVKKKPKEARRTNDDSNGGDSQAVCRLVCACACCGFVSGQWAINLPAAVTPTRHPFFFEGSHPSPQRTLHTGACHLRKPCSHMTTWSVGRPRGLCRKRCRRRKGASCLPPHSKLLCLLGRRMNAAGLALCK